MFLELKPYPKTKDSGVPWLGIVPEHWSLKRLRTMAKMFVSNVDKDTVPDECPVRLCNYTDVYKNQRIHAAMPFMKATATDEEVSRFRLEVGDVLITKDSESWNDIGVPALVEQSAHDLVCGYHLAMLRPFPSVITGPYMFRCFQSPAIAYQLHVAATGVTRYGLSHAAIKSVWLPQPPPDEQTAIVRFLDHIDQRIRQYIAAKQKLIKLLEEQKQAIIHRAVTRGIDSAVEFKPSGIEWLGDIPKHWEVVNNGRLFAQSNEVGFPELPILEVSLKTGVRVRDFENGARKQVMEDRSAYKRAAAGNIAYNMMRMWQGAVGVAPVDGLVSPAYVVAKPLPLTNSNFFALLFRTASYTQEVNKYSRGIVKDRNRLYWEDFKQMPSIRPPADEQQRVVDFIAKRTETLEAAQRQIQQQIETLREYRTRLIADVVTGKLDVREAISALSAEAGEFQSLQEVVLDSDSEEQSTELESELVGAEE